MNNPEEFSSLETESVIHSTSVLSTNCRCKLSASTHSTTTGGKQSGNQTFALPGENALSGNQVKTEENSNTTFQTELNIPKQAFVDKKNDTYIHTYIHIYIYIYMIYTYIHIILLYMYMYMCVCIYI